MTFILFDLDDSKMIGEILSKEDEHITISIIFTDSSSHYNTFNKLDPHVTVKLKLVDRFKHTFFNRSELPKTLLETIFESATKGRSEQIAFYKANLRSAFR